jgi:hypothetical protein
VRIVFGDFSRVLLKPPDSWWAIFSVTHRTPNRALIRLPTASTNTESSRRLHPHASFPGALYFLNRISTVKRNSSYSFQFNELAQSAGLELPSPD